MKKVEVKKGTILQETGALQSKAYYVKSGLLRSYIIDEKGKEHIFMFGPEGWIVSDTNMPTEPASLFIDVLEDAVLEVHDKFTMDRTADLLPPILRRLGVLQKRILMLMSSSAYDRYVHFLNTYPDITQRVPQRMIASYLGITPEALSKVKNDHLKEKK